jgi:hypothetical protein
MFCDFMYVTVIDVRFLQKQIHCYKTQKAYSSIVQISILVSQSGSAIFW